MQTNASRSPWTSGSSPTGSPRRAGPDQAGHRSGLKPGVIDISPTSILSQVVSPAGHNRLQRFRSAGDRDLDWDDMDSREWSELAFPDPVEVYEPAADGAKGANGSNGSNGSKNASAWETPTKGRKRLNRRAATAAGSDGAAPATPSEGERKAKKKGRSRAKKA